MSQRGGTEEQRRHGLDRHVDLGAARRSEWLELFDDAPHFASRVDALASFVVRTAGAGEAQHALDELRESRRLALHVVERPGALFVGREAPEAQRLGVET